MLYAPGEVCRQFVRFSLKRFFSRTDCTASSHFRQFMSWYIKAVNLLIVTQFLTSVWQDCLNKINLQSISSCSRKALAQKKEVHGNAVSFCYAQIRSWKVICTMRNLQSMPLTATVGCIQVSEVAEKFMHPEGSVFVMLGSFWPKRMAIQSWCSIELQAYIWHFRQQSYFQTYDCSSFDFLRS